MPSDVLITPATSKIDFTDGANSTKKLSISGTAFSFNSNLNVLSSTSLSSAFKAEGVNGTLFEVTDDLSNSLMSVNTIGGLPVFEVFANNSIIGGQYGANDFVISGNKIGLGYANPVNKLTVSGSVSIGSSYNVAAPSNGLIVQGDVGIGTATPTAQTDYRFLQVNGPVSAVIETTVAGVRIGGFDSNSSTLFVGTIGAFPIVFRTGVNEKWRISNAGVLQSSTAQTIQTATGILTLATLAGDGHIVLSPHGNGNVGVKTATPGQALEVNGRGLFTGATVASASALQVTAADASLRLKWTSSPVADKNTWDIRSVGTGATPCLQFRTINDANTVFTNRVAFTNDGDVGIGTVTPRGKLEISNTGDSRLIVYETGTAPYTATLELSSQVYGTYGGTIQYNASPETLTIENYGRTATNSVQGSILFKTKINNTTATNVMLINGFTGNVGIGATDPLAKLHVRGDQVYLYNDLNTNNTYFYARNSGIGNAGIKMKNSDGEWTIIANDRLRFIDDDAGVERLTILNNGNVGIGTITPAYKLDVNGTTRFGGIVYNEAVQTDDFNYFNLQPYIESETTNNVLPFFGTAPTFVTLTNTTAPFSKVMSFSAYAEAALADYIPVQAGETIYGEIWVFRSTGASGTAGGFYCGVARYDKDKKMIDGNLGLTYFIASNYTVPSTSTWTKYSGVTTLPLTHTPVASSDGGPARYVRPYIIVNNPSGTILTYITGWKIRKVELTRDSGIVSINGSVGVGTISPNEKLSVYPGITGGIALQAGDGTTRSYYFIDNTNPTYSTGIRTNNYYLDFDSSGASQNAIRFYTGTSTIGTGTERMRIASNGNIGIGLVTSPNHLLHLSTVSNDVSIGLYSTNANANARNWLISTNEIAYGDFNIKQSNAIGGNPRSAGTSRFYIQNDGNVGIGGAISPIGKLQLGADYANDGYGGYNVYVKSTTAGTLSSYDPRVENTSIFSLLITDSSSTTTGPDKIGLVLHNNNATAGAFSPMLLFTKKESGSTPYKATMAGIYARSPLGTGDTDSWIDGELIFATAGAASEGIKQRMVINKEGYVGIGITIPTAKLDVLGVRLGRDFSIANRATVRLDSNGTTYPSDVLFGHTAAANQDGWTSVYWSLSSRADANSNRFYFYRGGGNPAPNNSEAVIMSFDPNLNVGVGFEAPTNRLSIGGSVSIGSNYNTAATTNGLIVEGNVGIGITGPTAKLDVTGSATSGYSLLLRSGDTYNQTDSVQIAFGYANTTNYRHSIRTRHWPGIPVSGVVGNNIDFYVWKRGTDAAADLGTQFVMTMQGDGAVGIGVTNPVSANKLSVSGSVSVGSNYNIAAPTNGLIVEGDIGVGITSPLAKLHVNSTTSGATLLRADGTNGTLFSVVDDLSDSLMSVNNSAGLPVLEVFADDRVVAGQYGANDFVLVNNKLGLGTNNPQYELDIVGPGTNAAVNIITRIRSSASSDTFNTGSAIAFTNTTTNINAYSYIGSRIDLGGAGDNAQALIFATNATNTLPTEKMRIKSDGNIGIGTTNPVGKLDVRAGSGGEIIFGSFDANYVVKIQSGDQLNFYNGASAGAGYINYGGGATVLSQNLHVEKATGGTTGLVRINSNGNVGIGTTSPGNKLEVKGADDAAITAIFQSTAGGNAAYNGGIQLGNAASSQNSQIYHNSSGDNTLTFVSNYGSGTGNKFIFSPGGTEKVRFQQNGNVGIGTVGTTGPSNKLHVWAGTIQVSGFPSIAAGPITFLRSDYNGSAAVQINFLNFNPSNGYDSDLGIQLMNTSGSMVDVLRIKGSTGNVGIGKTTPNAKLNVLSTSSLSSVFKTEGVNGTLFEVTDDLSNSLMSVNTIGGLPVFEVFANNSIIAGQYGQNDFVISGNKVGIGTASPSYKLHVNGTGYFSGTLIVNGITINQERATNARMYGAGPNDFGLLGVDSAGTFRWQVYGGGGSYGFLESTWGNWDMQKAVNGQLDIRVSGALVRVLNAGTTSAPNLSIGGTAATATNVAWSGITSKPTTLFGFGITDALDTSATAQTKSGNLTVSSALTSGGNFYAATTVQYSNRQQIYTVNFGGGQDLAWKKIADVIVPSGLYRGITFKIDVVDNQGNFGWNSNCFTLTYFASCIRSGGVQDDFNNANVTGPVVDYVRVVKTATGVYELQIRQLVDWQTYIFTAEATINSGGCTVTYASTTPANGSTSGTIYTATADWTSKLANIAAAGTVTAINFSGPGTSLTGTAANLTAGVANSVTWTNVSGKPTAVSAFTNDSGYLTSVTNISGNAGTATTSDRLTTRDNRTISPSQDTAYRLRFGFTSWANNESAPYADYLHLRSYSDSSGGNDNLVMFNKNVIGMRIYQAGFGTSVAYSSFKDVAFTDQSFFIGTTSVAINRASAALTLNGVNISGSSGTAASATTAGSLTSMAITQFTGTLAVANGGTGGNTQALGRTGLGATTVGANLFTLANPSAISFIRINAANTVEALNAADFRGAISAGTVTSVTGNGGLTGTGTVTPEISIATDGVTTVKIANSNVTLAKIASIDTGTILGNNTGGAAAPLALTSAQVVTMLGIGTSSSGTVTNIATGDGLSGGPITVTGTITVDTTVVRTTGTQTIGGAKTFSSTIAGSINGNAGSVTDGVYLSTNQSIGGVKTFSTAPIATNIAKAWVNYNKSTTTINTSYNVSSVTSNGTGVFTVNFTNAMVDTNYVVAGTATYGYDDQDIYGMILTVPRRSTAQQTGSCRLATEYIHAAQVYDCVAVRVVFYR